MTRLSPEGRAFLEATRRLDEPTDGDRRRLRAKTLAALATAGAAGTLTSGAAAGGAGAALGGGGASLGWGGGAITGALLALAVLGGGAAIDIASGHVGGDPRTPGPAGSAREPRTSVEPVPDRREAHAPSTVPAAPVTLPPPSSDRGGEGARAASTTAREGEPPARGVLAARPAPGAPETPAAPEAPPLAARPAPVADAIDGELAALHQAQEALRAGRPDEAVRVLDRFAATHASVALEEERRAARIVAACKAGGGAPARADAERFLRERPDSPLGERVHAACLPQAPPKGSP
jgi:hypothetical protein